MTIIDLLCFLRQQLLDARDEKNEEKLRILWSAINLILDSAYQYQDRDAASLLEEMSDAIRDSLMHVEWKSTIPSVESIQALIRRKAD